MRRYFNFTDVDFTVSVIVFGLISVYGSGIETAVTSLPVVPDTSSGVLCRIVRNTRNMIYAKAEGFFAIPNYLKDCVISDSCTSLFCSTKSDAKEPDENFGWHLNLCGETAPNIDFMLRSASIPNSTWEINVSPRPGVQTTKLPLGNGTYYLNVSFVRWPSSLISDEQWSRLSLDVSIDTCNETCKSFNIVSGIQFPLGVLCSQGGLAPANLLKNTLKEVQVLASITGHIGMPCNLNDPFACGINSMCRHHEGGKADEGICDCCEACDVDSNNGSCIIRKSTSTEAPSHDPHTADDENSSVVGTWIGAFFSIVCLFLLGGVLFYGVKYNYFSRALNRLRLCWASHCARRRIISVADQGNIFNPLYDDDDPPIL